MKKRALLETMHTVDFPNRCEEWLLCIKDCRKVILCKKEKKHDQTSNPIHSCSQFQDCSNTENNATHFLDADVLY